MMKRFLITLSLAFTAFLPFSVSAQSLPIPECALRNAEELFALGGCDTCDMIGFVISLVDYGFKFLSLIVVVSFVVGGFMMIISPANPDFINRGKKMIVGAIVGVIIAFSGYLIVNVIIGSFLGVTDFSKIELFRGTDQAKYWAEYCKNKGTTPNSPTGTTGPTQSTICSTQNEGTDCSTSACTTNCECYQNECQQKCIVENDKQQKSATCVTDDSQCGGEVDQSSANECPVSAPVCCITGDKTN